MSKPYKGCVFCNGTGKFQHVSGRWYRCYCVKEEDTNE